VRADPPVARQDGPDVLLTVHVQPRASQNQLVSELPDRITLRLTAPPVEGAANAACRAFLAERLGLPRSCVLVLRGETSRRKVIRIVDAEVAAVVSRLQTR
jgi:uncharacterized protein (TIGR00251 family)